MAASDLAPYIVLGLFAGALACVIWVVGKIVKASLDVLTRQPEPPAPTPPPPAPDTVNPVELATAIGDAIQKALYGPKAEPNTQPTPTLEEPVDEIDPYDDDYTDPYDDAIPDSFIDGLRVLPPTPIPDSGLVSGQTATQPTTTGFQP